LPASFILFIPSHPPLPAPHPFPTRRSSDLIGGPNPLGITVNGVTLTAKGSQVSLIAEDGSIGDIIAKTGDIGAPDNPVIIRATRSEEHTSELQSRFDLVCRLLLEKKKKHNN